MRVEQAPAETTVGPALRGWFAVLCAGSAVCYATWLLGAWINPSLDEVRGYVSELSARSQPGSSLFRATDAAAGILAFAAAVPGALSRRGWARGGWAGLALFGLATTIDGALTPMDCATFVETRCALREAFGGLSMAHQIHAVTSSLAGAAALAAMIALGIAARRDGTGRPLGPRWAAGWAGLTALATGATLLALLLGGWVGVFQRFQLILISTWLLALAALAARDSMYRDRLRRGRMHRDHQEGTG